MSADTFIKPIITLIVLTILHCGSIRAGETTQDLQNKTDDSSVSGFGKYQGYSKEKLQRWVLASQYVEMRDGVKLAVDVIMPRSIDSDKLDLCPFSRAASVVV
jgi:hypothetical protein